MSTYVKSGLYSTIYRQWCLERAAPTIQPLEYDFYSRMEKGITEEPQTSDSTDFLKAVILQRCQYFLGDLRDLRKSKLMEALNRGFHVNPTYLSFEETRAWNQVATLRELSGGLPEIGLEKGQEESTIGLSEVMVEFLTPVQEFLGTNLQAYGPFAAGTKALVPRVIAEKVLVPRGVVRLLI